MAGPLDGVRVLDFTRYQQGPFATALLSDLGARVLKIEPRVDGEFGRQSERDAAGFSAYFEAYNRGKRSITLDIRLPRGKAVVERLLQQTDVLTENFRPGYMESVGLGFEQLHERFPRLIYAAASAYGSRGPLASRPGYDHVAQAVSGLMIEQGGGPGHEPVPALPGAADQVSAMLFALGITAALHARGASGAGQRVEVSLLGSMMALQSRQVLRFLHTGQQGRARFRRSPVYSHYRVADGWVAIAAQDPKRWAPLCAALERPDLRDDPRFAGPWERHHNAEALEAELEAIFSERSVADWLPRLIAADVPCAPVNDYRALVDDAELAAQLDANDYLATVEHPNLGRLRTTGHPITLSGTPLDPVGYAPELGRNTEEELLEAGYSWDEIEALRRDEII